MSTHSTIKRLSDNVINQIKAGEVVERPLNVVKELVENSIDALATQISIELLDGGKKLIEVSDNGIGIPPEQVHLATERHTTSKLNTFEDLQSLKSFGFRGEALASISSISQFSLKTKTQSNELGIEVNSQNNQMTLKSQPAVMNTGTTISVKDIFYNVPARLKFLRSTPTEFALITEFLKAMSLSLPHISFKLVHNGRTVLHYHTQTSLKERFKEIFELTVDDFVEVNFQHGSFNVNGFTILPTKIKSAQNTIITFVNHRFVKDKFLRSSIYAAYQGLIMKSDKPSAYLFIEMDPKLVDVNAHPSKTEIRFLDPLMVQDLLGRSVENSVKSSSIENLQNAYQNKLSASLTTDIKASEIQSKHLSHQFTRSSIDGSRFPNLSQLKSPLSFTKNSHTQDFTPKIPQVSEQTPIFFQNEKKGVFDGTEFLGQFLKCYLLFEKNTELWVVDQHAFHERVLFEELQKSYQFNEIPKQVFLNPTIINIDPTFEHEYQENENLISHIGFDIEVLKNKTLAIHAAPAFLSQKYIEPVFFNLSQKLSTQQQVSRADLYHDCFATIACHSAIRSGELLSPDFVHKLIGRAKHVDFFAHCPHGRPVIRKFSKNDVERWFERI